MDQITKNKSYGTKVLSNYHWYTTFPTAPGGSQRFVREDATRLQATKNPEENKSTEASVHTLSYKMQSLFTELWTLLTTGATGTASNTYILDHFGFTHHCCPSSPHPPAPWPASSVTCFQDFPHWAPYKIPKYYRLDKSISSLLWALWWLFAAFRTKLRLLDAAQDSCDPVSLSHLLLSQRRPPSAADTLSPALRISHSSLLCLMAYFVLLSFTQQNGTPPSQPMKLPALLESLPQPPVMQLSTLPCTPVDTNVNRNSWAFSCPSFQLHSCQCAQGLHQVLTHLETHM